jgi:hypothetical protein
MRTSSQVQLATVHRLRPRTASTCAPAAGRVAPAAVTAPRGTGNVIDFSRAARRRRHLYLDSPPEGTAA